MCPFETFDKHTQSPLFPAKDAQLKFKPSQHLCGVRRMQFASSVGELSEMCNSLHVGKHSGDKKPTGSCMIDLQ